MGSPNAGVLVETAIDNPAAEAGRAANAATPARNATSKTFLAPVTDGRIGRGADAGGRGA